MGPIWATRIWDSPYRTHAEPGCTPHMGSPYGSPICMFAAYLIIYLFIQRTHLSITSRKIVPPYHCQWEERVFIVNIPSIKLSESQ